MAVNISADLEGLTWGELRQFVRLADKTGAPDGLALTVPLTELAK